MTAEVTTLECEPAAKAGHPVGDHIQTSVRIQAVTHHAANILPPPPPNYVEFVPNHGHNFTKKSLLFLYLKALVPAIEVVPTGHIPNESEEQRDSITMTMSGDEYMAPFFS